MLSLNQFLYTAETIFVILALLWRIDSIPNIICKLIIVYIAFCGGYLIYNS